MSDDERIARLTELARRIIHGASIQYGDTDIAGNPSYEVFDVADDIVLRIPAHLHALDALEAALLVLAEDVTIREVRYAGCPRSVCRPASPAWVEQLAAALEYRSGVDQYVIDGDRWRELRARAKGGER